MSQLWRCKDCKQVFDTYELTAEHVRSVHARQPRSAELAETLKMIDDFGKLFTRRGRAK